MTRTGRLFLACLALSACGVRQKPGTGAAQIHVTLPGGSAGSEASQVTAVAIVVTGGPLLQPLQAVLMQSGATWITTINNLAVASDYTFEARALDANGDLLYDGEATPVPIAAGVTTAVSIIAQEVNPAPGPTEIPPSITAIIASTNNPVEGAGVSMTATVSAPAASQLTYAWTATYASAAGANQAGDVAGTFTSGQSALTADWTAPDQVSTINMNFCVTDSTGAEDCAGFTITVSLDQNGSASVTVTLNDPPVITTMTSSQYRMQVGDTITLTGAATTDSGTTLSYVWSTGSCNGDFLSAANSTPASSAAAPVATFTYGGDSNSLARGSCPFTFTVTDGLHASTSGTLTVTIGPNASTTFWPQITAATQTAETDFNSAPVSFSVVAVDINSPALPLTYTWTAQNMTFDSSAQADPTNCPACTSATYTPAACSSGPASATVTVSNGVASNMYTFNIQNCAPASCQAIHAADPGGLSGDGVYWIDPAQGQSSAYSGAFQVYCDMTRHGGGWQLVATYGPDRQDKNLNIDQSIGAELLSPAYSTASGGFIEGYSLARFQAYGSNYTVAARSRRQTETVYWWKSMASGSRPTPPATPPARRRLGVETSRPSPRSNSW